MLSILFFAISLIFFEKDKEISKELYTDFPNNRTFKSGLATAYKNLGDTHDALGNLDQGGFL